ncbi:hypothetical protein [Streptomyces tricolor]|uniref:hypothetical protein n=1 Tax=Streptomyces tricolor TaxID=68277 RepID=UPI003D73B411
MAVSDSVPCPDCGAPAEWHGVQVLLGDDSLRWDTETVCGECGSATAACGTELPGEMRERLLAEHGATELRLGSSVDRVAVMRVLRRSLGLGLGEARAVRDRGYGGTLPEVELLARRLRVVGVGAVAVAGAGR